MAMGSLRYSGQVSFFVRLKEQIRRHGKFARIEHYMFHAKLPAFHEVKAHRCSPLKPNVAPDKCALQARCDIVEKKIAAKTQQIEKRRMRFLSRKEKEFTCSKLASVIYTQHALELRLRNRIKDGFIAIMGGRISFLR